MIRDKQASSYICCLNVLARVDAVELLIPWDLVLHTYKLLSVILHGISL